MEKMPSPVVSNAAFPYREVDAVDDETSDAGFTMAQTCKIFDEVKALLKMETLQTLTSNIEECIGHLTNVIGLSITTAKEKNEYYELKGSWEQIVSSYNSLCTFSSRSETWTPFHKKAPQHDKASTCDIIKLEHLTRFALDHPRRARFHARLFQRSHSPIRRIKEKYRTKGRARPKRLINNLYADKFSESLRKKASVPSISSCEDFGSSEAVTETTNENIGDDANSENIEPPSSRHKCGGVSIGKTKPKKNYEELTPFKFFCKMCSFKTKRESHYHKHVSIHEKVTTLYKCDQCTFTSIRLSHLRRHEMSHSQTTFPCNQCSYKTDDVKLLIRHVKLKHEKDEEELRPRDLLSCPDCSYQTTKQYHYQRHLRVHEGLVKGLSQLFQCDQCSYKTSRKEHFIRHVNNVHSNKRPYLCDFCGKAFKRTDALKQHRVTHVNLDSKEAQFKCLVCDKSCRSHAHLMEHQAVHSNVRSFLCEICGASFKTRSVQRKHVLTIHKNPRSYSCEHCLKRFNTNYALRRHLRLHEPGADLCGQVVSLPSPPSHHQVVSEAADEGSTVVASTATTTPTQSVILFPASAATAVAPEHLQPAGSNNPLSAPTSIPFTIHPAMDGRQATLHLAGSLLHTSEASTSANAAAQVGVHESIDQVAAEEVTQMSQAFIQTNEATTALLYLTTNFAPF